MLENGFSQNFVVFWLKPNRVQNINLQLKQEAIDFLIYVSKYLNKILEICMKHKINKYEQNTLV